MKLNKLLQVLLYEKVVNDKKNYKKLTRKIKLKILGLKVSIKIDSLLDLCVFKSEIENYKPQPIEEPQDYIAITAILKNEAPYIKEWIEFHKLIGVERFYLYDNDSTDNVKAILNPYIEDGIVVYKYLPGKLKMFPAYLDAIYKYKHKTRWMAFIDLDEYLFPVEVDNIKEFLKDYEDYPAVVANWVMFDSNGLLEHPQDKLITEAYTRVHKSYNQGVNLHVKSIVNPKKVQFMMNHHFCFYQNRENAVTENFESCIGPFTKYNSVKKIRINHYHTKSLAQYKARILNGKPEVTIQRKFDEHAVNFPDTTYDYAIQKYLPKLKEQMSQEKVKL